MDLVDEQQCALPDLASLARGGETLLQVGDAGKDRRDLFEMEIADSSQQPRQGGLSGTRRPPEHQRHDSPGFDHAPQPAVGAEQLILTDNLVE